MDEEALVEAVVADGSRLESALLKRARGSRMSPGVAALDVDLGEWQILLPLPDGMSRLKVYNILQQIIRDLNLNLTVDRIVIVKPGDPGLLELRGSSSSYARRASANQAPIEVAGRFFVAPRELRVDPQIFERQIFELLRNDLEPDVRVISGMEASRIDETQSLNIPSNWRPSPVLRHVDIVAFGYHSTLLVEVKAAKHPIATGAALSSFGLLAYMQRTSAPHSTFGMMLVSATGFTPQTVSELGQLDDFVLTAWDGGEAGLRILDAARRFL